MRLRTVALFALSLSLPWLAGCDTAESPVKSQTYTTLNADSAALSDDGQYAVVGAQEEGGSLWDNLKNARLYDWNHKAGERSLIRAADFSPDGKMAVTATQQDLVLWHTDTGQPEWFWGAPGEVMDVALSAEGQFALLGLSNHTAVFFDIVNGGVKRTFNTEGRVRTVAISDDDSLALTGSDDYTATLWSVVTGEALHSHQFENIIDTVALSPNGNLAFTASSLDRAIIWDTSSGEVITTLSSQEGLFPKRVSYISARFSADGNRLLTGTASGLVQLWNARTGTLTKSWRLPKKEAYGPTSTSVLDVAFRQGQFMALGSNGILSVLR
jgi:WD40 repeat protein